MPTATEHNQDPPSDCVPQFITELTQHLADSVMKHGISYIEATSIIGRICLHHDRVGINNFDEVYAAAKQKIDARIKSSDPDVIRAIHDIRFGLQKFISPDRSLYEIQKESYRLSDARLLRHDCDSIVEEEIKFRLKDRRPSSDRMVPWNCEVQF